MRVNVHVERLVLDGLPVGSGEVPALQQALEMELAVLFTGDAETPLPPGGAVPRLRAEMAAAAPGDPHGWGRGVAGAVHRVIAG